VAEPKFPLSPEDKAENEANAKSVDLIGLTSQSSNGHNGGYAMTSGTASATVATVSVRNAMLTGVGMCPKCGGNLISQGGCIQCLQQCGYVGKCS
jgi:hypothetical protein